MYDSKMALAVKANSRVLREFEDAVYIPFGSEYSLLIKNLNSVRALVRIWIDGTDVTDGTQLVVHPNSSIDLERFIKNGNMNAGNKFKFIERTEAISEHRGNKVDDGLIRVEFEFEQPRRPNTFRVPTTWDSLGNPRTPQYYDDLVGNTSFGVPLTKSGGVSGQMADGNVVNCSASTLSTGRALRSRGVSGQSLTSPGVSTTVTDGSYVAPQSEVGITVEGAISNQQFHAASWFPTDGVKHVMVMRVLGEVEGKQVAAPVTVKTKAECPSCGKANKAVAKFCTECGTGLQIV